jgi:hypothetical protein
MRRRAEAESSARRFYAQKRIFSPAYSLRIDVLPSNNQKHKKVFIDKGADT